MYPGSITTFMLEGSGYRYAIIREAGAEQIGSAPGRIYLKYTVVLAMVMIVIVRALMNAGAQMLPVFL